MRVFKSTHCIVSQVKETASQWRPIKGMEVQSIVAHPIPSQSREMHGKAPQSHPIPQEHRGAHHSAIDSKASENIASEVKAPHCISVHPTGAQSQPSANKFHCISRQNSPIHCTAPQCREYHRSSGHGIALQLIASQWKGKHSRSLHLMPSQGIECATHLIAIQVQPISSHSMSGQLRPSQSKTNLRREGNVSQQGTI